METELTHCTSPLTRVSTALLGAGVLVAGAAPAAAAAAFDVVGTDGTVLQATPLETFDSPWAIAFLPDGRSLVSERTGGLWLLHRDGRKAGRITDTPEVIARGQGGMGDIVLAPGFAQSGTVYLSYVERQARDRRVSGAIVERATLTLRTDGGSLTGRQVIWRQVPKVTGNGHYGHRLAFSPDGLLFISSGERQKFEPAQDMTKNLGKIIRLRPDGSLPPDNPFADDGPVAAEVWSLGHRNPLGLAFDRDGRLWEVEMGPRGGDELNHIVRGANYGYPEVSEGRHYSGRSIPAHATNRDYRAPALSWTPVISPAALMIYDAGLFEQWRGNAFIAGLSARAVVRVELEAMSSPTPGQQATTISVPAAREAARYGWKKRVRAVAQGPDGAIYVLEDGSAARLLRLDPTATAAR
jgi:glucose/arabinose dehydrogenase